MKKIVLLMLVISASTICKLNAQTLNSDVNFLKATNHLWSAINSLDEIKNSDNQSEIRTTNLPLLKNNIETAKKYYNLISTKYPNNKDFKDFELWVQAIEKSYQMLNSDEWESNPTWQMGYTLIKMNLKEYINAKLK